MIVWQLLLFFGIGLCVSLFYFGGLWLTVKKLPEARSPGLLVFGSFIVRTAPVVFCFYLIAVNGRWQGVVACLVGFVLMRVGILHRFRPRPPVRQPHSKET